MIGFCLKTLAFRLKRAILFKFAAAMGVEKTSLLRAVCGLNDSFTGEVFWNGMVRDTDIESFRNELLFLGHRVGLNKLLSPIENLKWSTGGKINWSEKDMLQALSRNGLQGYEFQPCFLLSAGQQQRAALARLLIAEELMWVLDEPFNALDTQAVDMLEVVMGDHAKKGGIVLVTTHHRLKIPGLRTVDLS